MNFQDLIGKGYKKASRRKVSAAFSSLSLNQLHLKELLTAYLKPDGPKKPQGRIEVKIDGIRVVMEIDAYFRRGTVESIAMVGRLVPEDLTEARVVIGLLLVRTSSRSAFMETNVLLAGPIDKGVDTEFNVT